MTPNDGSGRPLITRDVLLSVELAEIRTALEPGASGGEGCSSGWLLLGSRCREKVTPGSREARKGSRVWSSPDGTGGDSCFLSL
jgi:hypothetical protein